VVLPDPIPARLTGFEGNYADTQSFLLSSGLRLLDRALDLHGSYLISDQNLELDPLLDHADRDRRLRLGAAMKALPWGPSSAWTGKQTAPGPAHSPGI